MWYTVLIYWCAVVPIVIVFKVSHVNLMLTETQRDTKSVTNPNKNENKLNGIFDKTRTYKEFLIKNTNNKQQ